MAPPFPDYISKTLAANYYLIFPAVLLIASLLRYKAFGLRPKAREDTTLPSRSSKMQRSVAQDIDILPSTRLTEPDEENEDTTRCVKQPFDVFLVLDVEATCLQGELMLS
jgi:hypothetical protein